MKNKSVLNIGILCLIVFMGISSYLWYLYFNNYENRVIAQNSKMEFIRNVELVNTGGINYVNAKVEDSDSLIPVYYFSVKNKSNKDFKYEILLEDATSDDGCTKATQLQRYELEYELKLDNKIIKKTGLNTLTDNILDTNVIKANSVNDYSLKIRLKSGISDYQKKHFHYVVNLKEIE